MKTVTGIYLITFGDNVQINGTTYDSRKKTLKKTAGSTPATTLNITGHQKLLSLPYLHRLNVENTRYNEDVIISISATFYVLFKLRKAKKKKHSQYSSYR